MPTIDEELNQIERDTRTLKIEYEQFFAGGRSRPPADTQWRVESLMRRYNERVGELSTGQRFRFNNLAQTYAKYVEIWRKKTVQKESATQQHHFGAAARAIEAERARQAASQQQAVTPAPAEAETAGGGVALGAESAAERAAGEVADAKRAFALSFSDPEHEIEKVHTLYRKLIDARAETGEKAGAPSLQDFERFVRQKTKDLKDKGGHEIEYSVSIEGGRVKLKARVSN
ncbi:MAG: MXAN_5187 C-terminal domain-containing protein [Candidatus Acidiferrales bacterium]